MAAKSHKNEMFRTETEFVHWLGRIPRARTRQVALGIGDDAALARIGSNQELVIATDLSIEGVHFTKKIHSARSVGHRALARALSDMAAMGATPKFALISLMISKRTTKRWLREFYLGIGSVARRYGVSIIGGDTAVISGHTAVDMVAVGEARRGEAVKRSGARPGDLIFVSGSLGMSELGLRLLQGRTRRSAGRAELNEPRVEQEAVRAHLFPQPRCELGRYLAEHHIPNAMMDISDGLSSDLVRLTEASGVGARICEDLIPSPEIFSREQRLALALNGGEDYELLFVVPPGKASRVPRQFRGLRIRQIGEICRGRSLKLIGPDGKQSILRPGGYDHFRKN